MKFRVYNEINIDTKRGFVSPTYFKTKREAVAYAEKIGENAVVEKKIADSWFTCQGRNAIKKTLTF